MRVPEETTFGEPQYEEDQIVVAIPHLRPVLRRLAADDLRVVDLDSIDQHIDRSEALGLALVELPSAGMARWEEARKELEPTRADSAPFRAPRPRLDALLGFLYDRFESEQSWIPTIGKNRAVDEVVGNHTIGVGDEGVPTAADAHPELRPRDGDPGAGVLVGVADTAFHRNEWLEGGYSAPPSTLWREQDGRPLRYESGHATFVTGTILQQAPGAVVSVRRVLGDDGTADSWSVAKALVQFERLGIDVLNLSLGCFTDDDREPLVLSTALARLNPDLVVVASAGNHGQHSNRALWPAALPRVVAVGATDDGGQEQDWSPKGPWVDVLAPGFDVVSTYIPGVVEVGSSKEDFSRGLATWSGTSFSAARVSGAVAARTEPGRTGAATALRELLAAAPERGEQGLPWIQ
jgi:subtilisin family serine protease